jgi:predicted AAA+ superfamily ATPase
VASWQPSPEEIRRVLDEQNPWHRSGSVPPAFAKEKERNLAQFLWARLTKGEPRRFQLVLGPRRVGKTTVMYQTVRRLLDEGHEPGMLWWLRLDHPVLLRQDLGELVRTILEIAGATEAEPVTLFLDELVYAEDWDLWLKTFYDDRWPVRVLATSSATAALRDRRLESGVGRWEEQYLSPYLLAEYLDLIATDPPASEIRDARSASRDLDLVDVVSQLAGVSLEPGLWGYRQLFTLVGGFPELLLATAREFRAVATDVGQMEDALLTSQQVLRADAVERAIYKDIPQSFGVESPMMLERLLYVLAGQLAGLLSPTNISRDIGLSQPTLDKYVTYLEQAFLVFTLPNYSPSESAVQRRGRKLYFVDGAVRNAALQRGIKPLGDSVELGLLLENLVAATMWSLAIQSGVRLFHWRERKNEVDLVFDHPTAPLAIEVGSSPSHDRGGLIAFRERHPRFEDGCYLVAPGAPVVQPQDSRTGVGSLPVDEFLMAAGWQSEAAMYRRITGTDPPTEPEGR